MCYFVNGSKYCIIGLFLMIIGNLCFCKFLFYIYLLKTATYKLFPTIRTFH